MILPSSGDCGAAPSRATSAASLRKRQFRYIVATMPPHRAIIRAVITASRRLEIAKTTRLPALPDAGSSAPKAKVPPKPISSIEGTEMIMARAISIRPSSRTVPMFGHHMPLFRPNERPMAATGPLSSTMMATGA